MNTPPLIEIHDATIWRGTTRVFHQFSLTIDQRERVAILGPNGSGKTTLLKAVNRELYPVANETGWIKILGRERWNVWELREHIGLVSQDLQSGFLPTATALETIVSGFFSSVGLHYQLKDHLRRAQVEKGETILAELGLEPFRDREFQTLSTGQQRRCLLGRALIHNPQTLILDEPTSGLDLTAGFDYLSRIRALARQGRNLVLVTHHINEIPPEIDRVIMLKNGAILADGPKNEVLTAGLLSEAYETPLRLLHQDDHFLVYPG